MADNKRGENDQGFRFVTGGYDGISSSGKVDSLFLISHFLNFDAGRRLLFIMTSC